MDLKGLCVVLLLFVFQSSIFSQGCINVSEIEREYVINGENYLLFVDSTNALTIEDVTNAKFEKAKSNFTFVESDDISYWVRFCIKGNSRLIEDIVAEVYDWQLQKIEFYSQDENGGYFVHTNGSNVRFEDRNFKMFNLVFNLNTRFEGERYFYVKVRSKRYGSINFRLRKVSYTLSYAVTEYFLLGIYYGVILLIIFLNLFLWYSTKETIFGYYLLFVLSLAFQSSLEDGTGFQYLWNRFPDFTYFSLDLSKLVVLTFASIYVTQMIRIKKNKYCLILFIGSFLVYAFWHLAFVFEWLELSFNGLLLMLPYSVLLMSTIYTFAKDPKNKVVKLFLVGFSFFYLGVLFIQLRDMGLPQWLNMYESFSIMMNYSVNIAVLVELTLFTFALSQRFGNQKSAELEANRRLIVQLQENELLKDEINRKLETKVQERTSALLEKSQKLEAMNIEMENIMHIVAHDLRTPLNRVQGIADLISLSGVTNEEQKSFIDMIKKTVKEGNLLINNILELHQHDELGKTQTSNVPIDHLFEKMKLTFFAELEKKKIRLVISGEKDVFVRTNEEALTRILENLVSNAIKFSDPDKEIELSTKIINKSILILVKDQGLGFDENDMKNVFKKFTKLSSRPTQGETSNGLGLSIVKNLVEKLDGKIQLESEKGKGSVFTITLPLD